MSNTNDNRGLLGNSSWQSLLIILSVLALTAGMGITWGRFSSQISANSECLKDVRQNKIDAAVYRSDVRRLEEKIDKLTTAVENLPQHPTAQKNPHNVS